MSKKLKYKIKELILKNNLRNQDLADYCRKNRQTITNWCNIEQGSPVSIPRIQLIDLAEFFGCDPVDLLTDPSEMNMYFRKEPYRAVL